MIDAKILDQVIPAPTLEELKEIKVAELQQAGFVITKFNSGGVFNTLLMITLQVYLEMLTLLRTVLNSMFVAHASGVWLDIKAADYSKQRKQAIKARGYVTVTRQGTTGEAIKIPTGHVFKTEKDLNGGELRFLSVEETVLQKDAPSLAVLVEAEQAGSEYNVPPGQISRSLTYLSGVATIANTEDWVVREGSDTEDDEGLRARTLRSWSELARVPIRDTYINVCEAVPGVLYVTVNDQHPRGQGTIDVIVTSAIGAASQELLAAVEAACDTICAPDDNVLVKSSETVTQAISLTVTLPASVDDSGISDRIKASVTDLLRIRKSRALNELTHADIIFRVKSDVPMLRNVIVTQPATDLTLDSSKVILAGEISVTITGV